MFEGRKNKRSGRAPSQAAITISFALCSALSSARCHLITPARLALSLGPLEMTQHSRQVRSVSLEPTRAGKANICPARPLSSRSSARWWLALVFRAKVCKILCPLLFASLASVGPIATQVGSQGEQQSPTGGGQVQSERMHERCNENKAGRGQKNLFAACLVQLETISVRPVDRIAPLASATVMLMIVARRARDRRRSLLLSLALLAGHNFHCSCS